jgi:hypothetical protein
MKYSSFQKNKKPLMMSIPCVPKNITETQRENKGIKNGEPAKKE